MRASTALGQDEEAPWGLLAFALSRMTFATVGATPISVFRAGERPNYDELMEEQLEVAKQTKGAGDLEKLLHAGDTWRIQ